MAPPAEGSEEAGASDVAVVQHPRMRQRRAQVLEDETRRRRKRWLWVALPVVTLGLLWGLAHTPPFAVAEVLVEGGEHTADAAVLEASGIDPGQAMLTLDERAVQRRVEALPWVEEADVVRAWPRMVRIEVTERTPVAVAVTEAAGPQALVDATGRVVQLGQFDAAGDGDGEGPGLVVLTGLDDLPEEGEDLPAEALDAVAIAARAPELVPDTLEEISVDLDAVIAPGAPGAGAVVRFRSGESVDERLVALDTLLTDADLSCLATVDLTVPDRPVVTRHPGC